MGFASLFVVAVEAMKGRVKKVVGMQDYMLYIYHYDHQYIFTGVLDMYFEKYRGEGPGIYRNPILAISDHSGKDEFYSAALRSLQIMEENRQLIFEDNTKYKLMEMDRMVYKNFHVLGIRASRKNIENAPYVVICKRCAVDVSVFQSIADKRGGSAVCLEKKDFERNTTLDVLSVQAWEFFQKYPQRTDTGVAK